jgi:CBS domain containing-hemolysin-like protein
LLEEGSLWGPLILQVILLFINAVFASAEIAVISMNDNRIAKLTLEGDKRAIRLTKLTEDSSQFLSIIQIAITLASLGASIVMDEVPPWAVRKDITNFFAMISPLSV